MHPGVGSRLVYRQLLAVGGLSFALSKRFESVQITCEQAGKRMEQNRAGGGARRLRIGVTAPQGDGPEGRRVVGRPCGPESRRADQGRSTTKPTLLTAPAAQPPPPAPLGSYNSDRYIPRCSRCIRYILYIRYIRYSNTRAIHPIRHILNPQARAKRRRNHSQCLPHKKYNNKKQYTARPALHAHVARMICLSQCLQHDPATRVPTVLAVSRPTEVIANIYLFILYRFAE